MNFKRAITFSFENPKWWLLSLILLVANNVPILGPIVLLGYLAIVFEKFVKTKKDSYEDFDFKKLTDYFKRGIWPLFAHLIIVFGSMIIFMSSFAVVGICFFCLKDIDLDQNPFLIFFAVIGFLLFLIISITFSIFINMITTPVLIAALLTQGLKSSFSLKYLTGFIKRTWKEQLLVMCFYLGFTFILFPIIIIPGAILLIYVIIGPIALMQWHLHWQIYEIYLKKGGKVLPMVKD